MTESRFEADGRRGREQRGEVIGYRRGELHPLAASRVRERDLPREQRLSIDALVMSAD